MAGLDREQAAADTRLVDGIEVLGIRGATVHPGADAVRHSLAAALPAELGLPVNGRGERSQTESLRVKVSVEDGGSAVATRRSA